MPRNIIFYRNSAVNRMSPVALAAKSGDLAEVKRLMDEGYKADHHGEYGITGQFVNN